MYHNIYTIYGHELFICVNLKKLNANFISPRSKATQRSPSCYWKTPCFSSKSLQIARFYLKISYSLCVLASLRTLREKIASKVNAYGGGDICVHLRSKTTGKQRFTGFFIFVLYGVCFLNNLFTGGENKLRARNVAIGIYFNTLSEESQIEKMLLSTYLIIVPEKTPAQFLKTNGFLMWFP
jgi:hypothetical protein